MAKFVVCPHCGEHLDFGEKCDCRTEKKKKGTPPSGSGSAKEKNKTM